MHGVDSAHHNQFYESGDYLGLTPALQQERLTARLPPPVRQLYHTDRNLYVEILPKKLLLNGKHGYSTPFFIVNARKIKIKKIASPLWKSDLLVPNIRLVFDVQSL